MKVTITRRSIVGFGYTAGCIQTEHGLQVADVDKPDYTGTIKQVMEQTTNDRTLKSFESGGTYYNTAWFIKVDSTWRKVKRNQFQTPPDLLFTIETRDDWSGRRVNKYTDDAITVEVI